MLSLAADTWQGVAIGGVSAALAAAISAAFAAPQARRARQLEEDMARLNSDLETEVHARIAEQDRAEEAEEVLKRYREPLAAAAFDLQSRLFNILRMDFFDKFAGDQARCALAEQTTLFRFAQYFGWTEILRRDIQFLAFPEAAETQEVQALQSKITKCIGTSEGDRALMVWTDEQRAIGESMIVEEYDKVLCMGFARFHTEYDQRFAFWCDRLRPGLHEETSQRLLDLQHLLCDLVETLDSARVHYTEDLQRA